MCGRYVRKSDKQKIAEYIRANPQPAELPMPGADYNIAPTTFQPIIRQSKETGEREIVLARWGLVPFFTKSLNDVKGMSTINARAESITKAPTWREQMKKGRCIVPANSFYEWEKAGEPPKKPYSFELANGNLLGFAGSWDAWKDKDGHWLQSFAIVTTEDNELMAPIHPRMPCILYPRVTIAGWTAKRRSVCRSIYCGHSNRARWKCLQLIQRWATCGRTGRS